MGEKYYYSATTGGFYLAHHKEIYKSSSQGWPDDAIAVSDNDYKALFAGQEAGKVITADSKGRPILADPVTDWQTQGEAQRQSLLSDANSTISLWQTELLLGSISDDDKASLIKWMAYIKAVKALDFTGVTDEESYKAISWPDKP